MAVFRVIDKKTHECHDVYDITYDAITGYPQFLIYKDGQWLRVSAKHYRPPFEDWGGGLTNGST